MSEIVILGSPCPIHAAGNIWGTGVTYCVLAASPKSDTAIHVCVLYKGLYPSAGLYAGFKVVCANRRNLFVPSQLVSPPAAGKESVQLTKLYRRFLIDYSPSTLFQF